MFRSISKRVALGGAALVFMLGGLAAPTLADQDDWDRIDQIRVSQNNQKFTISMRDMGPYDRIAFRARGADVRCRSIRIIFRNGHIQYLDRRTYEEDNLDRFDLDGQDRRIDAIHFDCRPMNGDHARLVIRARID